MKKKLNKIEQKEKMMITTTTTTTTTSNFETQENNGFFNLSLSTIFSTRIDDHKTKDDEEEDYQDEQEIKDETKIITSPKIKGNQDDKPRRPHPFPFTSPSYLKNLEKSKSNEMGPKKRNHRKRHRSKKNTQDEETVSIRRKSEYRTEAINHDKKGK